MRTEDKETLKARLNRLGEQWGDAQGEGNEAVRMRLQNDIFCVVFELFPNSMDAFGVLFEKDWKRFDPAKGNLYGFISARLPQRVMDLRREDLGLHLVNEEDPATSKKRRIWKSLLVQEADHNDDTAGSSSPQNRDNWKDDTPSSQPEDAIHRDEAAYILISSMLNLNTLLKGKENNPQRQMFFQMFFTSGITNYLQGEPVPDSFLRRERDLFRAIKLSFLDFYMSMHCRSLVDISLTALRPYGELVDGRPMEETRLPLRNDVYCSYLARVEDYGVKDNTVSTQMSNFISFIKKCLS